MKKYILKLKQQVIIKFKKIIINIHNWLDYIPFVVSIYTKHKLTKETGFPLFKNVIKIYRLEDNPIFDEYMSDESRYEQFRRNYKDFTDYRNTLNNPVINSQVKKPYEYQTRR